MSFISFSYYVFLVLAIAVYYIIPKDFRWYVLLSANIAFIYIVSKQSLKLMLLLSAVSYIVGWLLSGIQPQRKIRRRIVFLLGICLVVFPLGWLKAGNFFFVKFIHQSGWEFFIPLGLSFFTMQMISYMADVYTGKIESQKNPLKYLLFITFFPQLLQGPIPRYSQLEDQLLQGHIFRPDNITRGIYQIIWGFFLKLMIADKIAVMADHIFANTQIYRGGYVLFAGIFYSIQLYADFQACTKLAQGSARMFGIRLTDNFNHPYLAVSVKDFWGRWHISLSRWLRDYVYIPLGGNRNGRLRKYVNLTVTFVVSGIWHGQGYKFIAWGLFHAVCQIAEDIGGKYSDKIYQLLRIKNTVMERMIKTAGTWFLVGSAWVVFRADRLREGIAMLKSLFTVCNPWIFFDNTILSFGLDWKELFILCFSLFILIQVSLKQESGKSISDILLKQPMALRWTIYICAVAYIWMFGTYGYGFNAQDFIYGGF